MNREIEGVSPFTVSQWQELEHQALIYKYLIAGLSVPPDLVQPIQNSFQTSSSFLGYCGRESSMYGFGIGIGYGKKVDPEPGRCRRTDGKKWRCSKEAYPDSKYCERHMHRGRNRSRKHVESHSLSSSSLSLSSSSSSSSSSVSAAAAAAAAAAALNLNQTQNYPLKFNAFASASASASNPASNPKSNHSQFQLDSIPYAIPTKHYSRHLQGVKPEAGENISFSQCSGGNRSLLMDSAVDNTWPSLLPQISLFSPSKLVDDSSMHNDYSCHSFINNESAKQGNQSLHPFFEEWPKNRESWSSLEHERANPVSFSTTQLSISLPMAASDFSTSSQSPRES